MSDADVHARAAAVRSHRLAIEERILAGDLGYAELFAAVAADPVLAETKLLGLIESIPDIGKVQTRRAFEAVGLAETVRIGAVTSGQQEALATALELA